jgi:hypothetical protein
MLRKKKKARRENDMEGDGKFQKIIIIIIKENIKSLPNYQLFKI